MLSPVKIMGVVLCGGQSTRMGTDKGLLHHHSVSFAGIAIGKLEEVVGQVVLSVNSGQYPSYSAEFPQYALVKDHMDLAVYGPLKGILSVHLQYPEKDLLVLACDMISMHADVLRSLLNAGNKIEGDAFVCRVNDRVEPLCGIYSARGLNEIYQRYTMGKLLKNSMHYILDSISTCYIPADGEWTNYFKNYNSRDDLHLMF